MMCSKSQQAPASRTLATLTAAAAAAAAATLMASSSSSVPILGVEAFSPFSPFMPNNHRLLLDNQRAVSSSQRINNSVQLYAAEAEIKDDESESESKSDGNSPAPAPTPAAAEDEVSRQLAKAKELIERTKQKMESKEKAAAAAAADQEEEDDDTDEATASAAADEDDEVVPFFAVDPTAAEKRRQMVTKTKDEESGLITTDGEKMASLADGEKWESRGLYDLFENEIEEDEAAKAKEARASRDVARSMMNLKMIMNKEDFDFIFDKKNRWIGEE